MARRRRINWRTVLFNIPQIVLILTHLKLTWPTVRKAALSAIEDDPNVAEFISAVDQLLRVIKK